MNDHDAISVATIACDELTYGMNSSFFRKLVVPHRLLTRGLVTTTDTPAESFEGEVLVSNNRSG